MNTITPTLGDAHVLEFCASVVPGSSTYVVECMPLFREPFNECFAIVPKQIAAHGGSQLTGWTIWEVPGVYIEAEFHAVWQRPDGVIVDITPRPVYFPSILFLPDPERQYVGRQVDNVRKPLVQDKDVVRFLHLCRRRFEILNEGDLANQNGVVALSPQATREYRDIVKEMTNLQRRLDQRYAART